MGKQEIRSRMTDLEELVGSISYRSQLISRTQKLDSGMIATRRIGFIAGFLTAVILVLVIPLVVWHLIGAI